MLSRRNILSQGFYSPIFAPLRPALTAFLCLNEVTGLSKHKYSSVKQRVSYVIALQASAPCAEFVAM